MRKVFVVTAAVVLLGLGIAASAAITIDTVTVGNPGNAPDTPAHSGNPAGQGAVSYTYNIGKYEVTAGQYTAFLNAVAKTDAYGLYNVYMSDPDNHMGCNIQRIGDTGNYSYSVAADYANRPVNYVSFWDSCRFANWLHNGQKSGIQDANTTECGAYTLVGYNGTDGRTIQRNANWTWAVTSEDEWYKAAYYKGVDTNDAYWLYPTQNNSAPGQDMADASGNNANYYTDPYAYPIDNNKYFTVVGEFQNSASAYGTFDQGGNVWEWNEAITFADENAARRGKCGGWCGSPGSALESTYRSDYGPSYEDSGVGFRVVQAVPEPSSFIALLGGFTGLIGLRRRRA